MDYAYIDNEDEPLAVRLEYAVRILAHIQAGLKEMIAAAKADEDV